MYQILIVLVNNINWFLVGQEFTFEMETGKTIIIKLVAIGQVNELTRKRDVFFLLNGESRVVGIVDEKKEQVDSTGGVSSNVQKREKADPDDKGQIGAPMTGMVVEVKVKVGQDVKVGDALLVLSAMKMETVVTSTVKGKVKEVLAHNNDSVNSGDLIVKIEEAK